MIFYEINKTIAEDKIIFIRIAIARACRVLFDNLPILLELMVLLLIFASIKEPVLHQVHLLIITKKEITRGYL